MQHIRYENLDEISKTLAQRFIARPDVKAVQSPNGAYRPLRDQPFGLADLNNHISGRKTYGHYMLDEKGRCKLAAFDIDTGKADVTIDGETFNPREVMGDVNSPHRPYCIKLLRTLTDGLQSAAARTNPSCTTAVAYSGNKGMHVYLLFPSYVPARDARLALRDVLAMFPTWQPTRGDNFYSYVGNSFPGIEIETFPKQDKVTDLGNLMRLPLGVHKKTNNQAFFVDTSAPVDQLVHLDPMEALK